MKSKTTHSQDNPVATKPVLHQELQGLRREIREVLDKLEKLQRKDPDSLLTRDEAAERLSISTRTLDDMADAGEIQPVRIRGRVLYSPATLDAYIRRKAGEGR